jgi:hypothetical protein
MANVNVVAKRNIVFSAHVAGHCDEGNEPLGSIKGREFLRLKGDQGH